jgi:hypothetical protein
MRYSPTVLDRAMRACGAVSTYADEHKARRRHGRVAIGRATKRQRDARRAPIPLCVLLTLRHARVVAAHFSKGPIASSMRATSLSTAL